MADPSPASGTEALGSGGVTIPPVVVPGPKLTGAPAGVGADDLAGGGRKGGRTDGPRWLATLVSRPNSPAEGDDDLAARACCRFAATLSHLRIPDLTVSPAAEASPSEAEAAGAPSPTTLGPPATGSVPAILGPPAPSSEPTILGPPTSEANARPGFGRLASLAKFSANCLRMVSCSSALTPGEGVWP